MKYGLILTLTVLFIGCDQRPHKNNYAEAGVEATSAFDADVSYQKTSQASSAPVARERMLIKTGQLSMKVDDVTDSKKKITAIAQKLTAYISEERLDDSGYQLNISMTVRVPSQLYDSLIVLIEQVGKKTESKSVNTQDVTEEFIDTEARLKTKKELETRYREILRQAQSVNDILSVETQLNNVRAEIESMEGRLKYLSSQVSFSTLNLSFYQSLNTDFGFAGRLGDGETLGARASTTSR